MRICVNSSFHLYGRDIAVPIDHNVKSKKVEKILKYKDNTIKMQQMWNVKVKIVPRSALKTFSHKFL